MPDSPHPKPFPSTRWTRVLRAGGDEGAVREKALAELCEQYWPPVYAFVRSRGNSPHDAEDLTQGFFAHFLSRDGFAQVEESRGKLRSYFLASVKNFMAKEWRSASSQKRGGGEAVISLDLADAESRVRVPEPREEVTPETIYDRQWAMTLLEVVLGELRERYVGEGKAALFEALRPALVAGGEASGYAELGVELGLSEPALRVAAHRMRKRYGKLLRSAVADTLGPEEDLDEELGYLMGGFG